MSKLNKTDFREKITKTIEEIEKASHVEIVGVIYPQCGQYLDGSMIWGLILALTSFTFLMFYPMVFGDYLLYTTPIVAYFVGVMISTLIPPVHRLMIAKKRMFKMIELKARAVFQKAQLHQTKERIGILLLFSEFEKKVFVLPDVGVSARVPEEELSSLIKDLNQAIRSSDVSEQVCNVLKSRTEMLAKYIPQVPDDINELPNTIHADL